MSVVQNSEYSSILLCPILFKNDTYWRRKWQPTPIFLPGKNPWTEESGGLKSMGLHD